jgi:general secretion pathway protein J
MRSRFARVGRGDGFIDPQRRRARQPDCAMRRPVNVVSRGDGIVGVWGVSTRQRGFTLIEILLATTLLAAGLALGFATLRAATATVDRGERLAERTERMRAVEGFLRRRLASATPIAFAIEEDSGRMVRFVGDPDRVRFVADLPNYLGRGGPHLHDVAVLDGEGGPMLAVAFTMAVAGGTIEARDARPPEPLVPDLAQARFRYRGLGEDGQLGEWTDRWEQVDTLPLQVSLELSSRSGGVWPPLVVSLPQQMGGMVP